MRGDVRNYVEEQQEVSLPLHSLVKETLARNTRDDNTLPWPPRDSLQRAEAFADRIYGPRVVRNVGAQSQPAKNRVLAIGAHPDDVEIGCGGTLAKHKGRGDELMILTLSKGTKGGDTAVREQEARRAANLLGATLELNDFPDTQILDDVATIDAIQTVIRDFRPTHIYTHSPHDAHQDHRSVFAATLSASRGVKNVYSYQSPSSTVDFRPNHFVDVTQHIDSKIAALSAHESQVSRSANLGSDFVVATAVYWGRYIGNVMAEPMEVVRQTDG
jgi:LmbE family N-acetylglucosaminyl deacetylase